MKDKEMLNQYETCDRILEYALEAPEEWHSPIEIRDKFLSSVPIQKVEYLFDIIAVEKPSPAKFEMNIMHNFLQLKKNEYTEEFLSEGGFSKIYDEKIKELKEESHLKELEKEQLQLETENLKYQKTIRNQEQRIRNLTEQNNFISLIKNYWWLLCFLFFAGYAIAQVIDYLL